MRPPPPPELHAKSSSPRPAPPSLHKSIVQPTFNADGLEQPVPTGVPVVMRPLKQFVDNKPPANGMQLTTNALLPTAPSSPLQDHASHMPPPSMDHHMLSAHGTPPTINALTETPPLLPQILAISKLSPHMNGLEPNASNATWESGYQLSWAYYCYWHDELFNQLT